MSSRKKSIQGESPKPLPGQTDLPFDQAGPDVQANGQPGSNGQTDESSERPDIGDDSGPPTSERPKAAKRKSPTAKAAQPKADMFDDLESLRLSQDFATAIGVKKHLTTIPVVKPSNEWFCRVHPSPDYRISMVVLESKVDGAIYVIDPPLRPELDRRFDSLLSSRLLVTAINRQKNLFLWPIKLPRSDGKIDRWNQSARDAANMALTQWVQVASNLTLGAYEVFTAEGQVPEPEWPEIEFSEILRIAFRDSIITELDHPVLKRLRGGV